MVLTATKVHAPSGYPIAIVQGSLMCKQGSRVYDWMLIKSFHKISSKFLFHLNTLFKGPKLKALVMKQLLHVDVGLS